MTDLHNTTLIGPDGVSYRLVRVDGGVKKSPEGAEEASESVGKKIRRLRKTRKWSQSELGEKAGGITQATVSRIETGETPGPHESTISDLLNVLEGN